MKRIFLVCLSLALFACGKSSNSTNQVATPQQLKIENDASKMAAIDAFMATNHELNALADATGNKKIKSADLKIFKDDKFDLSIVFTDEQTLTKTGKLARDYDSDDLLTSAILSGVGSLDIMKSQGPTANYCARVSIDTGVSPEAPAAPIQICETPVQR